MSTRLNLGNSTQRTGDSLNKRKWDQPNKLNNQSQFKKGGNDERVGAVTQQNKPLCKECGKYHFNKCLMGKRVCFVCEKPGHEAMDCPTRKVRGTERKGNAR